MTAPSPVAETPRDSSLIDRLRGRYVTKVNDGAGLLDGRDTVTRQFETAPIQHEAAREIERLEREIVQQREQIEAQKQTISAMLMATGYETTTEFIRAAVIGQCICPKCGLRHGTRNEVSNEF